MAIFVASAGVVILCRARLPKKDPSEILDLSQILDRHTLTRQIKKTATKLALSQSDLQCVLGISIQGLTYSRLRLGRDLSVYHFRIICSLVMLSITVHMFTCALFKSKFRKSSRHWLRGLAISVDSVAGVVFCALAGSSGSMPAALFLRCTFAERHATGSGTTGASAVLAYTFAVSIIVFFPMVMLPLLGKKEPTIYGSEKLYTWVPWVLAALFSGNGMVFVGRILEASQAMGETAPDVPMSRPGSERDMTYGQWLGIIVLCGNVLNAAYTFSGKAFKLLHPCHLPFVLLLHLQV